MYPIKEVSDVMVAFPVGVSSMMPAYKDLPEEFRNMNSKSKWHQLVSTIFFRGVKKIELKPRPGVDTGLAMRHIKAIMHSWEPKHEHKTAACAFLFNEWFEDVEFEAADPVKKP